MKKIDQSAYKAQGFFLPLSRVGVFSLSQVWVFSLSRVEFFLSSLGLATPSPPGSMFWKIYTTFRFTLSRFFFFPSLSRLGLATPSPPRADSGRFTPRPHLFCPRITSALPPHHICSALPPHPPHPICPAPIAISPPSPSIKNLPRPSLHFFRKCPRWRKHCSASHPRLATPAPPLFSRL